MKLDFYKSNNLPSSAQEGCIGFDQLEKCIKLKTGSGWVPYSISVPYEANLKWGGKNHSGAFGPIDAAMIPELGANRFAFYPNNRIVGEYSKDGGSTWEIYSGDLSGIFGSSGEFRIGNDNSSGIDKSKYMCRITLTTSGTCYSTLNKFALFISSDGSTGSYCTIQARLQSNVESEIDTWATIANKVPIKGWSGWNIINTTDFTTYGNQPTSQYGEIRFTFGVESHPESVIYGGLRVVKILGFGGVGGSVPSRMAQTGHIYSWDNGQNAVFPAKITSSGYAIPNGSSTKVLVSNGTTADISKLSCGTAQALTWAEYE